MLPMLPGPDSPWSQPENAHPPEKPRRHRKTVRVRLTRVDRRLKIGVALQAGAILSFPLFNWLLSGYFAWLPELVISIPLFLASPFFLMNSKAAPLPLRLGLSFWYLVLVPIQLVMTVYNSALLRTEIVLIPRDYLGFVTIHFDDPAGAPAEYEGKKPVFRIGSNGELRTQMHEPRFYDDFEQDQTQRRELYWVDRTGARTRFTVVVTSDDLQSDRVLAFDQGIYYSDRGIDHLEWFVGTAAAHAQHYKDLEVVDIRESYEIPSEYHGWVTVIFDGPGGPVGPFSVSSPKVFRIGTRGVLRTPVHEPKMSNVRTQGLRDAKREFVQVHSGIADWIIQRPVPYDPARIPKDSVIVAGFREKYGEDCVSRVEFFAGTPAEFEKSKAPSRDKP